MRAQHNRFLGRSLADAGMRVMHVADCSGIRGMIVQTLSDEAKVFYEKSGVDTFATCPLPAHYCLDNDCCE
jgi:hypothetical protein